MPASLLTASELARARRSFDAAAAIERPGALTTAVALWASIWGARLLEAAEAKHKTEPRLHELLKRAQPVLVNLAFFADKIGGGDCSSSLAVLCNDIHSGLIGSEASTPVARWPADMSAEEYFGAACGAADPHGNAGR